MIIIIIIIIITIITSDTTVASIRDVWSSVCNVPGPSGMLHTNRMG